MSNTDQLSTPSLSSSSSTTSSRPSSPSLSTNLSSSSISPVQIINKPIIKTLDLNSYFSDLDGEEDYNNTDELSKFKASTNHSSKYKSKTSNFIQFDQIETLNGKTKEKFGIEIGLDKLEEIIPSSNSNSKPSSSSSSETFSSSSSLSLSSGEEEEEDDEEEDEEDQEWVQTQWKALVEKQKIREKAIRKLILSRQVLNPLDLKEWLDSDQTCDLPALSLGVLLRMDPMASSSHQMTTISKY